MNVCVEQADRQLLELAKQRSHLDETIGELRKLRDDTAKNFD